MKHCQRAIRPFAVLFAVVGCLAFVSSVQAQAWGVNTQEDKLPYNPDGNPADTPPTSAAFGSSVAVSGQTAIIGASGLAGIQGRVHFFNNLGPNHGPDNWFFDVSKPASTFGGSGDKFGASVSIDRDTAIVGAPGVNSDWGMAYVFKRTGATWDNGTHVLLDASTGPGSEFGASVATRDDSIIVGAPANNSSMGSAHIYQKNAGVWDADGFDLAGTGYAFQNFGRSVAIDGDLAVVGAPQDNVNGMFSGSAYIFQEQGSNWVQLAKLTASDGYQFDSFGTSVAIHNNVVLVGSPYNDEQAADAGAVYAFVFDGSSWTEEGKMMAHDGTGSENFGKSVTIEHKTGAAPGYFAVIGAPNDDDDGGQAGAAYLFHSTTDAADDWTETPYKLLASDGAADKKLGSAVGLSSGYAIVGAPGDRQFNDNAGAAYYWLIPEPSSLLLVLLGGLCLSGYRRRRKQKA